MWNEFYETRLEQTPLKPEGQPYGQDFPSAKLTRDALEFFYRLISYQKLSEGGSPDGNKTSVQDN